MTTKPHPENTCDIAIVGGGLVGATMAISLANTPLRITLIDTQPAHPTATTTDPRAIALTHHTQKHLQTLGLWHHLKNHATPIAHIHTSDRGHFGMTRISAEKMRVNALGHVVDIHRLNACLKNALPQQNNLTCHYETTVRNLAITAQHAQLTLQHHQHTLAAKLVIAADGTHSFLRNLMGIATDTKPYGQYAIASTVTLSRTHHHTAYERFTENGAIAMLPLDAQRCGLVWTVTETEKNKLLALSDEDFLRQLQQTFGYRLGKLQKINPRRAFPLTAVIAKEQIRPHFVLLGNATHTLHPIAAQGFNLGLLDTMNLSHYIQQTPAAQLGVFTTLLNYYQTQQRQQQYTQRLTHGLTQVFTNKRPLTTLARNVALTGLEICPPIKQSFADFMMGYGANTAFFVSIRDNFN